MATIEIFALVMVGIALYGLLVSFIYPNTPCACRDGKKGWQLCVSKFVAAIFAPISILIYIILFLTRKGK